MVHSDSLWSTVRGSLGSAAMLRSSDMTSASLRSFLSELESLYFSGPDECKC